MLRHVKRSLSSRLTIAIGLLATGCGGGKQSASGGSGSGGLSLTPGVYYNLVPGICAEYSNDAGGGGLATVGVHIQTATSPVPGIELRRTMHGVEEEEEYLSFDPDGGGVFLAERQYPTSTTLAVEVYSTPLKYLPAPPLGTQELDSSSVCGGGNACITMSLDVSVESSAPYTGAYSVPDGGQVETQLGFIYQYNGDGGTDLVERGLVPGIGFTDLYLLDDTMNLSHYLLVDIIPDDGGVCAEH
jgi:hypothetical protein